MSSSPTTLVSPITTASDLNQAKGVTEDILLQSSVTLESYPGAISDFYGLPTNPICIYKTGDAWPVRKGPEAQRVPREARPICNHPIQHTWPTLGTAVYTLLDSLDISWTTIDPVRFAEQGGIAGPLHLWIGIVPRSLSFEDAKVAAEGCKEILINAHFPDVEIAFRESILTRSTGPQLLNVPFWDPITDLCSVFTPFLGVQIAPRDTPDYEGTGALYLRESSKSERVFLLTACHVARPPPAHNNELYERKTTSKRAHEVLILGNKAYEDAVKTMTAKIKQEVALVDRYERELQVLGEAAKGEAAGVTVARQVRKAKVANAKETITSIKEVHGEITEHWSTPSQRVLGCVIYAPPISVGTKQFTEDWALIDIYRDKIDWNGFKGNVVYLGDKISDNEFIEKMHPHPEGRSSFKYPVGHLLQVKGVVKEDEIRKPKQLDASGEECLLVIKNGKTTGVTIGRGTGIESFLRVYDEHGIKSTSMEVAVHSYSHKDGPFSAPGDSGSIVIDGNGRIVGLLTGGAGALDSTDVTYLTPYFWLEGRIKQAFPNSYLYPIVN